MISLIDSLRYTYLIYTSFFLLFTHGCLLMMIASVTVETIITQIK